jgi:hypothetical protein
MRALVVLAFVVGMSSGALVERQSAFAQVEIDRIVSRVSGRLVTQSDIRRAQMLKLVDAIASDEATQRALETRLLVLHELNRAAPLPPSSEADVDARRTEWLASVSGDGPTPELLRRGNMSEGDLEEWLRDDLRIRAYLRRQFGMLGDAERSRAVDDWLARLRQRADLPQ